MNSLVTEQGLKAWINRNIALRNSDRSCFHTYQECFRTLDGRVPFSLHLLNAFPCAKQDNLVTVSLLGCYTDKVSLYINTRRWDVSVCFFSALDDEDFESDIPEYAKAFRQPDEDGSLFSMTMHDPPTQLEIQRLFTAILQLQHLKPCGCGRPAAISPIDSLDIDFCVKCELTLTGTPAAIPDEESKCIICMDAIVPGTLNCCGVKMHAGCRKEHFEKSSRCPHCRCCSS